MSKILVLDIEWAPTVAYVWQPWKENIHPEKIIKHGGLLCVGCKWIGEKQVDVYSEWEHGHFEMVKRTHAKLEEADAVVTYNGDRYDLRKLQGEFLLAGLKPPPPPTSIDLLKSVKKLGLFMNRLAFVAPFLGLGDKTEHEGFALWRKVDDGDKKAQKKMHKYCAQDVKLTEKLYEKIKPYIHNHPHLSDTNPECCGTCGSSSVQKRGYRRTKFFRIQRLQCQV